MAGPTISLLLLLALRSKLLSSFFGGSRCCSTVIIMLFSDGIGRLYLSHSQSLVYVSCKYRQYTACAVRYKKDAGQPCHTLYGLMLSPPIISVCSSSLDPASMLAPERRRENDLSVHSGPITISAIFKKKSCTTSPLVILLFK